MDSAQRGDQEAFAELWRWLQPPLLGWLRILVAGSEEEVAADTWVYVARRLPRFEGDSARFRTWVFATGRRRAIDCTRRHRARLLLDDRSGRGATRAEDDPGVIVSERDATAEALDLVRRLPPLQAQVVGLRVIAGLSVSETARAIGRKEGAVRVLCHRGLESLAAMVGRGAATPV